MNSQGRYFLGGILVGILLTVCAALFVGPEIYVTASANNAGGRYELTTHKTESGTEYAVFDSEAGTVRVLKGDGTWENREPSTP